MVKITSATVFALAIPMLAMASPYQKDARDEVTDKTTSTNSGSVVRPSSSSTVDTTTPVTITSSTAAPVSSTASSGPLYGDDNLPRCPDFYSATGADWLVTAFCAVTKCSAAWIKSRVSITSGDDDSTVQAADFTVFALNQTSYTKNVKWADAAGSNYDNGRNDTNNPWVGGGLDHAVMNLGGNTTVDGNLITGDDDNDEVIEMAGAYALTYLTGVRSLRIVPLDEFDWKTYMSKITSSPVLIRTTDDPDASLQANSYYSVNTYSDSDIVIWNPRAETEQYITVDIEKLRTSSKYLYHLLDWATYTGDS